MGVSEDDADQGGDESDSDSDLQESATDSSPESATGDCLTCSDTEEAAVTFAHKKFHKKLWAYCSPAKQGLYRNSQLEQIASSHQAV